jgi:hypothetical protein
MNVVELQFGEWLPDQADYKNPGLIEAENVYPIEGGYSPLQLPNAPRGGGFSGGFSGGFKKSGFPVINQTVIGAKQFFRNDGLSIIVGGTSTKLFTWIGTTDTETAGYTAASRWRFERFNDLVVAVSKENAPQYLTDIDTDVAWSALPGTPPKAAQIGKVDDYLVLGDVDDGTDRPNRVQWSAKNNPTVAWIVDPGELSGWQDLDPKYGRVTGIVGGRWGLVFQERAIWRMSFVGAPKAFQFDLVTDQRGCSAPDSIVTIGYETYFIDRDGLFVTNGSEIVPLGEQRVNRWLEGEMDPARRNLTQGAINWPKACIVWTFWTPGAAQSQRQLIYSVVTKRFSSASVPVQWLVATNQDAQTLGSLGALFPGGLATMALPIGGPEWQARDRLFSAFVTTGKGSMLAPFTGPNAAGYLTTGDYTIEPGRTTLVSGVCPIVERKNGGVLQQVRSRQAQGRSYATTPDVETGADGFAPFQVNAWFHGFRTKFEAGADWDKATGLWVRAKRTGKR